MTNKLAYTWTDFSANDKAYLRSLKATFVMAPREISEARVRQLVKETLPKGNVVFGVSDSEYVEGFEDQQQFRALHEDAVLKLAEVVERAGSKHRLYVLYYPAAETDNVIRAVRPHSVVVVRGSYLHVFHRRSTYALLNKRGISFDLVSPFIDEAEAKRYLQKFTQGPTLRSSGSEKEMLANVREISKQSFDYSFQTGVVLADKMESGYSLIDAACNEVVPYQTYALHFGNSREEHLSPRHDLNHYDTIHAEMNLLVRAMKSGVSFEGKTLFINMLPCPSCARTLVKTGLDEVVYGEVHSDGYALELFEKAGIKTRKADV